MAGLAAVVAGFGIATVPGAIGSAFYLAGLFVFSLCVGVAVALEPAHVSVWIQAAGQ